MIQQLHFWGKFKKTYVSSVNCSIIHNSQDKGANLVPTDEWIKKMWYIYTMKYYSSIKKNEIMPFVATCMQLEILILREVSKIEKEIPYDITYM